MRIFDPPVEGRVEQGGEGLDVGDRVRVKLIHTDPERGFIDFALVGAGLCRTGLRNGRSRRRPGCGRAVEDAMRLDRDEIAALTEEYGGAWGINHSRRLLHLVTLIRDDRDYDDEVVWLAAHLHDWGGYSQWAQSGVDHAVRSAEVAAGFLAPEGLSSGATCPCP